MVAPPGERGMMAAVVKGTGWTVVSRLGSQVFSIVSVTIVARLVAPEAYGLVGMAQVLIGFAGLFRDIGTAAAIVQRQDLDEELLSSVFWLNLALGAAVTAACLAIAPGVAWFYRQPAVLPVFQALSLSFLIASCSNVHAALAMRRFQFARITAAELSGGAAGLLAAVTGALLGAGVWSLVAGALANAAVATLVFVAAVRWRPQARFSPAKLRALASFGLNLSGFNMVNYFGRNTDNLLIGKFLGATPLGFYGFAYNLMLYPVQAVAQTLGRVLFPAFARMQDDYQRLGHAYLRACAAIAFLTFPMMAGVAILAAEFVAVLLGPRWAPVAPVLRILAPVGLVQSVVTTVGHLYTTTGRTDLMFRWGSLASLLMVMSFVAGLPWGMLGVAAAYALVMMLMAVPLLWLAMRLIGLPLRAMARTLQPVAACTAVMAAAVAALRYGLLWLGLPAITVLGCCTAAGAAVYFALMYRARPPVLADIHLLVRALLSRKPALVAGGVR